MANNKGMAPPVTAGKVLRRGVVLPAMPLALDSRRRFDERRQRALCRYYLAAGAGGLAVGVHTTQFAIRESQSNLFRAVLEVVADEAGQHMDMLYAQDPDHEVHEYSRRIRVAGICGRTAQAAGEAALVRNLDYDCGLLNLAALKDADDAALLEHCRQVAEELPLFGFYLQPAVGGRVLSHRFWCRFAEIENVVAIKIAPFNRYQTLDVIRAVAEVGRDDIALYTGNDDNIVADLVTPFRFQVGGRVVERRIVGGLLGQWAVGTRAAVELLAECQGVAHRGKPVPADLLARGVQLTQINSAIFDAAHGFAGCIPGIHEVLRRQGLLEGTWCLDPQETLSPGQAEEIDGVCRAYPHLLDEAFVAQHRDAWVRA
jgi:dihydrodipicolinate synthase/N-acetylneuraminate lyase